MQGSRLDYCSGAGVSGLVNIGNALGTTVNSTGPRRSGMYMEFGCFFPSLDHARKLHITKTETCWCKGMVRLVVRSGYQSAAIRMTTNGRLAREN